MVCVLRAYQSDCPRSTSDPTGRHRAIENVAFDLQQLGRADEVIGAGASIAALKPMEMADRKAQPEPGGVDEQKE